LVLLNVQEWGLFGLRALSFEVAISLKVLLAPAEEEAITLDVVDSLWRVDSEVQEALFHLVGLFQSLSLQIHLEEPLLLDDGRRV
jgi:hypothetical protein